MPFSLQSLAKVFTSRSSQTTGQTPAKTEASSPTYVRTSPPLMHVPYARNDAKSPPSTVRLGNQLLMGGVELDVPGIRRALDHGAFINSCDGDDNNVLHKIANAGTLQGSTSGEPTTENRKALEVVFRREDLHGERINLATVNDDGDTPLHIAARTDQAHFFKSLLDAVKREGLAPSHRARNELRLDALSHTDASGKSVFDLAPSPEVRALLGQLFEIQLMRQFE